MRFLIQSQIVSVLGVFVSLILGGCSGDVAQGPPVIRYGDSVCSECGMILSDKRFASALVVVGGRGDEPLVFDDLGCQIGYEKKYPEIEIVDRWMHDYTTGEWISSADAWFVRSDELRSPMGSNIAAFGSLSGAKVVGDSHGVEPLGFDSVLLID